MEIFRENFRWSHYFWKRSPKKCPRTNPEEMLSYQGMTLKIDLDPEAQKSLESAADLKGIEAEDLAAQLVVMGLSADESVQSERPEEPWSDEKNKRRCQLIDQQIEGEITQKERLELNRLQMELRHFLNKEAGFDLDSAKAIHRKLLQTQS